MRADLVGLSCGALALVFYFTGQIVPAAVVVAIGVAVLIWAVLTRH